jgi:hypothetical protein
MPVLGQGILPPAGATASELTAITRRNFVQKGFVQYGNSSPIMSALIQTSKVATGGVSPITVPVQGTAMTSGQWIGYDGTFQQPGNLPGFQNAEFNLKGFVTPIPFLGMEGLVQIDYSIVPLIEARMNDAVTQTIIAFSTALENNYTNQQQLIGFQGAIDDGSLMPVYGGINRTTSPWWKSTYVANTANVPPTRGLIIQYIAQVTKKTGEKPKLGACNFGTWTQLALDYVGYERFPQTPASSFTDTTIQSMFSAIEVAGVPIYADPYIPEGTLWMINSDYIGLFIHERAAFYFTGFESTLVNAQFGYIAAILTLLELVNVKPVAQMKVTGLQYLNI